VIDEFFDWSAKGVAFTYRAVSFLVGVILSPVVIVHLFCTGKARKDSGACP
jgi:hypothetical protein